MRNHHAPNWTTICNLPVQRFNIVHNLGCNESGARLYGLGSLIYVCFKWKVGVLRMMARTFFFIHATRVLLANIFINCRKTYAFQFYVGCFGERIILKWGVIRIYCDPGCDRLPGVCEFKFRVNEVFILGEENNQDLQISKSLDNDQRDAHLLYFLFYYNASTTILYMFQTLHAHHQETNCIDAASGIVLSVSGHPVDRLRENCSAVLSQPVHRMATD